MRAWQEGKPTVALQDVVREHSMQGFCSNACPACYPAPGAVQSMQGGQVVRKGVYLGSWAASYCFGTTQDSVLRPYLQHLEKVITEACDACCWPRNSRRATSKVCSSSLWLEVLQEIPCKCNCRGAPGRAAGYQFAPVLEDPSSQRPWQRPARAVV